VEAWVLPGYILGYGNNTGKSLVLHQHGSHAIDNKVILDVEPHLCGI
jgi:hypothetical protein